MGGFSGAGVVALGDEVAPLVGCCGFVTDVGGIVDSVGGLVCAVFVV